MSPAWFFVVTTSLASDACALEQLALDRADIDDYECAALCSALERPRSALRRLSLVHNLIGAAEQLNAVDPGLVTGGEALAAMLGSNRSLRTLDVSWNLIRKGSADALARSLRWNATLTELNLAHNAFADGPTQQLGDALGANRALTKVGSVRLCHAYAKAICPSPQR
jgi:hypothetical protein